MLDRMANRAESIKNYALTAQLIEQAAKECGDAYTNKLKVETTGRDGGGIRTETTNLTAEEAGRYTANLWDNHQHCDTSRVKNCTAS
jgi:hypothetical protein